MKTVQGKKRNLRGREIIVFPRIERGEGIPSLLYQLQRSISYMWESGCFSERLKEHVTLRN